MINYEPNYEYQDDIEKIVEIYELLSDLKDIEINEDQVDQDMDIFRDVRSVNSDIQKNYNNLYSSVADMEDSLEYKLQSDFDDKINTYVYLVENRLEKDEFPFNSWSNILNKKKVSLWKPNASWLKANNFPIDNISAQYLAIYNGKALIEEIKKNNITELKVNLETIKQYYNDPKRKEFENIYNYLIFEDYKGLGSVFHNIDVSDSNINTIKIPELIEKKWTFFAGIELASNWDNDEYKRELLLLLKNTGTEDDKKNFVSVLLGEKNNPKGLISSNYQRFQEHLVYRVIGINWDMVNDFLKLNKELEVGLESDFFIVLEKIVKDFGTYIKDKGTVENLEYTKLNYYLEKKENNKGKVVKI